jgi:hypothetical protein
MKVTSDAFDDNIERAYEGGDPLLADLLKANSIG